MVSVLEWDDVEENENDKVDVLNLKIFDNKIDGEVKIFLMKNFIFCILLIMILGVSRFYYRYILFG